MVVKFHTKTELTVGRGSKDHIKIDDISVSRKHALLKLKKNKKTK